MAMRFIKGASALGSASTMASNSSATFSFRIVDGLRVSSSTNSVFEMSNIWSFARNPLGVFNAVLFR